VTEDSARPLGEWLRHRREELDISLEQADTDTRIRARYLEALEAEDLEALPNTVVARGFLRNYASYLELDPQQAIDRYEAIAGPSELESPEVSNSSPFDSETFQPVPLHEMPAQGSRWWLPVGLLVILVAVLAVLVWQGFPYISDWLSEIEINPQPASTRSAASAVLPTVTRTTTATIARSTVAATIAATAPGTATPEEATPTQELSPTPTPTPSLTPSPPPSLTPTEPIYTGIFLELLFNDISWIQVTVDEIRQFQGELEAGTYRSWYGEERIELRVGNAGAVDVTVNGQKIGPLGEPGEVVDRIFEIVDDQVTEATPTRAPTLAPPELTATGAAPIPVPTIAPTTTVTPTTTSTATTSP
jgi:cytoskeleton protein RodZ